MKPWLLALGLACVLFAAFVVGLVQLIRDRRPQDDAEIEQEIERLEREIAGLRRQLEAPESNGPERQIRSPER